jgi:hypothetical protein
VTLEPEARRRALIGVVGVVLLAGSFAAGRFSAPLRVETREVEKEVVKWREKLVEKEVRVEVAAKVLTKTVYVDRVITKEGEIRERIVERTAEASSSSNTGTKETEATSEGEKVREVEKVRTVTLQPDWRVAVMAGASWNPPLIPIAGPLVLGASVDRRIVGGFSLGIWGMTGGALGGQAALVF